MVDHALEGDWPLGMILSIHTVVLAVSLLLHVRLVRPWVRRRITRIESELNRSVPDGPDSGFRFPVTSGISGILSEEQFKHWVSQVLSPALRSMGVDISRLVLKRGAVTWDFLSAKGLKGFVKRRRPVSPNEACGEWLSMVDATGKRRFSFLLPRDTSRDDAVAICRELCRASRSGCFRLEISGMPGREVSWTLCPGWTGLLAGQCAGMGLVCLAWMAGMSGCGETGCMVTQTLDVRGLWFMLGGVFPFMSWMLISPATIKYGDDLYIRGVTGAARNLMVSLPLILLLAAGLSLTLAGVFPATSSAETMLHPDAITDRRRVFAIFATLHMGNALLIAHVAASRGTMAVTALWGSSALALAWFPRAWYLPPLTGIAAGMSCLLWDAFHAVSGNVHAKQSIDSVASPWSRVSGWLLAMVAASLLWGDRILMMALFPAETIRPDSSLTFLLSAVPALSVGAHYFTRWGVGMSRLWNATAKAMTRGRINVLVQSRRLMKPAFDLMLMELCLVAQASCLGVIVILTWIQPEQIDLYLPLVYSAGFSGIGFVMAVYLSMLSAGHALLLQIAASIFILFAWILTHGYRGPVPAFEVFRILSFLSVATVLPPVVAYARRVTSLPEYRGFWRKHAIL